MVWDRFNMEDRLALKLQAGLPDIETRIDGLIDETGRLARGNQALERRLALRDAEGLLESRQDVDGVAVLSARADASNVESLRETGDWLRDKLGSGVVVLGSVLNGRPMLIAMVTADLVEKGFDATSIARGAAKAIQGGGGGRPDVAQAGGKLADKLDDALDLVPALVREKSGAG